MRGKLLATVWLLIIPLVTAVSPRVSLALSTANDFKIVPGERIGDVSLNMSIGEIQKALGAPSRVNTEPTAVVHEWQSHQIRTVQFHGSGEIASIRTYWILGRSNKYKTEKGLGVEATEEQVRQTQGISGCFYSESTNSRLFWWPDIGIFYFVSKAPTPQALRNKVHEVGITALRIVSPGAQYKSCT